MKWKDVFSDTLNPSNKKFSYSCINTINPLSKEKMDILYKLKTNFNANLERQNFRFVKVSKCFQVPQYYF